MEKRVEARLPVELARIGLEDSSEVGILAETSRVVTVAMGNSTLLRLIVEAQGIRAATDPV